MRAFGLPAKIAAACGLAVVLLASLDLPWYGPVPPPAEPPPGGGRVSTPLDGGLAAVERWIARDGGRTGWELAGRWDTLLAWLAGLALVSALLCLLPSAEHAGRGLLQLAAHGAAGIVATHVAIRPDGAEPRVGLLVALASAVGLTVVSAGIAACGLRRRPAPIRRYAGTAPPAPYDSRRSAAPPGIR